MVSEVARQGTAQMAAAEAAASPLLASSSWQLKARVRASSLSPPLLPIHFNLRRRPAASTRFSSSSYNGWADLAADPFALPLQLPQSPALLPLLLLPFAALSLSRFPPFPLLAAAFAAGFAARHLAPASPQSHRLAAVLADLDTQVRAFKDQLASAGADADAALLLDAVDRVRDALVDAARLAGQGGNTVAASDALPPVLGDVVKEVAYYFSGWARETMRELSFSSPRKKPKDVKVAAAAVDAKCNSDVAVLDKGNKDAVAAAGAQAQQEDGDKPLDSAIHASTKHSILGEDNSLDSVAIGTGSARAARDMLPFDKDANGSDNAGFGAQSTQEDGRLERLVFKHRYGHDGVRNDPFQGGSFATESMESSLLQRTLEIRDRSYRLKIERRGGDGQVSEAQERPAGHFVCNAASFDPIDDEGAATDSDGGEFSHNVKEAAEILRKARECMMARADEETADALLYKSARLLSTAVALRPTSLVVVGQLGNTYLHGELKLKISRELRTLLANSRAYLNGRERVSRSRKLDQRILSRENISSALVGVCEECESLLVKAGRSYRMAMSIDSDDIKALYNWGLALIFRAQLLADIGPEAAVDADRVYLAAIDKFDAMLSKSNTHAPEALYRWGSALQQRSHLRSGNIKEKIRLLEQAKSMFEDVLYVEADNKMVREALSSCISELNYHGRWL